MLASVEVPEAQLVGLVTTPEGRDKPHSRT